MKVRSGRKAVASALATAALALTLLPGAAFASGGIGVDLGPLNVQRDCGVGSGGYDAQGQCSYNIAQPSATQDASAVAVNENEAATVGLNLQKQVNVLEPDASVVNVAKIGDVSPESKLIVESGSVDVWGHDAYVDMSGVHQSADAAPKGFVAVINDTGSVGNMSHGDNFAASNAGAANDVSSSLGGGAFTDADGAYIGGWGGDGTGNIGGYGPTVEGFGVDGGWGGSNLNGALGVSLAAGGFGGGAGSSASQSISPFLAFLARNGEAESEAEAIGGNGTAGFGAQANPTQNAGNGGAGWFTVTGNGGAASGNNNAYGGAGSLTNTNTVSGNPTATGTAIGGTAGDVQAGNYQLGITGQNETYVDMSGGIASNALSAAVTQSGAVMGWSGAVSNSGSPSVNVPISVNQGSSPRIDMTNTPSQSGSNTGTTTQTSSSGAQTVSPYQNVSTGEQGALNVGAQDAFKAFGSFNTDNSTKTIDNSNQDNATNNGEIELELGSSKYHR